MYISGTNIKNITLMKNFKKLSRNEMKSVNGSLSWWRCATRSVALPWRGALDSPGDWDACRAAKSVDELEANR
ncbi:hypothetical protein D505_12425 [Elizabethkingia anophelis R26]|uniref:Bacteriocin n=2 Tax=Elizabethkingia anophelis TaxID=1117645 RepID=A0ABM6MRK9_9FLAO|nr:hypothetical protein BAZ09_004755 [Elizabethkingia anophelis R26]ATC39202.1 hypothetical protein EAAG1_004755 [Elizabethkingia anophelis Ag1]ATC42883.1 hypothetical protein CMV41_04755 [Elizabethkingia anophelis]ATC46559.1 hypothetical protein CMV40_04755 [Elizabethkingia anophelis]ELR78614.1 hypothetical protein D505_12425 [Elizabethkingia anophelis R26]